ncbi:MAG: dipeptide ABC transporter ATP-binding protein [Desulfobacteraceae bacterium]|nr:dipeptide ABC transporter ATP-binding protein [Desulfobacteraceae bacterium]
MNENILTIKNLKKYFPVKKDTFFERRKYVKAVDGISFTIREGETLGLVGESGCGKSTVGKVIVKLLEPTAGTVSFRDRDIYQMDNTETAALRKEIQMIFQDPYSSLDPRQKTGKIIMEPLIINKQKENLNETVLKLMRDVGLLEEFFDRYPHEFSGGQRQRIGIARALALNPSLIVCDEPVSALDVSIQAQIVNMMQDIQAQYNLTYLFISHDLGIVRHISNRIAVMYLGRIVEIAEKKTLFSKPLHPYTLGLLKAIPIPNPNEIQEQGLLQGDIPSPIDLPEGCRFHTRCERRMDICTKEHPIYREVEDNHFVECHLYD